MTNFGINGHIKEREKSMIINVSEAKTNLSKLLDRVYHGEKIVIAKNNIPIADLVAHKPTGKRKLGLCQVHQHAEIEIKT